MKTTLKPQSATPNFLMQAEDASAPAQSHARASLALHDEIGPLVQKAADYDAIFSTAHVCLLSICCLFCAIVDAVISRDVYLEAIQLPGWWLIVDIGVIVLALKTGHYLRTITSEEVDLMVYEEAERHPDLSDIERRNRVSNDVRKDKNIGYIILTFLIAFVACLSYHRRVELLNEPLSVIDAMPVLFLVLTCLSSIHVFYMVRRMWLGFLIKRKSEAYAFHHFQTREHTAIAAHYFAKARQQGIDTTHVSRDLNDTVKRFLSNSSIDANYAQIERRSPSYQAAGQPEEIPFENINASQL